MCQQACLACLELMMILNWRQIGFGLDKIEWPVTLFQTQKHRLARTRGLLVACLSTRSLDVRRPLFPSFCRWFLGCQTSTFVLLSEDVSCFGCYYRDQEKQKKKGSELFFRRFPTLHVGCSYSFIPDFYHHLLLILTRFLEWSRICTPYDTSMQNMLYKENGKK